MQRTRCVFLDRDGVINRRAALHDYIKSPAELHLLPNIADWIRIFNALGFLVIVVTNQRGVARGLISPDGLEAIHSVLLRQLAARGAHIDDVFVCPHEEDSCDCRKPRPGLIYQAREKWNIDLDSSLMIGDEDSDQELARVCGLKFLRAGEGKLACAEVSTAQPVSYCFSQES